MELSAEDIKRLEEIQQPLISIYKESRNTPRSPSSTSLPFGGNLLTASIAELGRSGMAMVLLK